MSFWSRIERRLTDFAGELLPDEFRLQVGQARELLGGGHPAEAAELLEAMLRERPEHTVALSLLGAARLELGQLDEAREAFGRAVATGEDFPEAFIGLGEAALAIGEVEPALDAFRSAVRLAGGDRAVLHAGYRGLGMAWRAAGDLDKAIRELRKAVAEQPDDPVALAALGEALVDDHELSDDEAQRLLERALEIGEAPPAAALGLGRIALRRGQPEAAREHFAAAQARARELPARAVERARAERLALIGMGDAELLGGDPATGHRRFLEALALAPRDATIHTRIGDAHRRVGNLEAALASYEHAVDLADGEDALRAALDVALAEHRADAAVRLANRLLARFPDDPRATVARGVALRLDGQLEPARATFQAVLRRGDDLEAHLALAELELATDPSPAAGARAAQQALAALRVHPAEARARTLLAEARSRELGDLAPAGDGDPSELRQLALALQRLALARPELAELAGNAAQAAADHDQPLLVTIMGEFSSGKSTFVNAFIGHDAAPTGITPTTATINVVKYGRELGGRFVYRDGRVETLPWEALGIALRGLTADKARAVATVEMLLPLEILERINLVDTPGLNSILPEHEATARGFIARADAVVWLFTAGQAGKASERAALARIRGEGVRVLGVLNKVDQLGPGELDDVLAYVRGQLGDLVEAVVPLSARQALAHRMVENESVRPEPFDSGAPGAPALRTGSAPGEAGAESKGNWQALAGTLEERFFTQARQIKRQILARRLGAALQRARERVDPERAAATTAAEALRAAAGDLRAAGRELAEGVVAGERRNLVAWSAELHRRAAREILELVRPRRLPFGQHSATQADRDYLVGLLDSGYEVALERSRRTVTGWLEARSTAAAAAASAHAGAIGAGAAGDLERTGADLVRLVEAEVFLRCRAYLRGYLRGGWIDGFFRDDLPRLELSEDNVYHAIVRNSPDVDAEIANPLQAASSRALAALAARLDHWAAVAEMTAWDIDVGVGAALAALEERLGALRGS